MNEALRFGILGCGNIAGQFARDAPTARRSVVTAAGSRSRETAETFAQEHGIARAHGSYGALLKDPEVDAVYLTLPNTLHREWAIKALEAGKHVLCEKPLAMSAADAEAMFDAADKHGRVLIEAYMYRTHPLTKAVVDAVRGGAIGELRYVRASFSYRTRHVDGNIRFDASLGGGALMDVGGYCLSYARLLAGCEPDGFEVFGHVDEHGVDDYTAGSLRFDGGRVLATFTCGMAAQADNGLHLGGTEGYLDVPVPWKPPRNASVYTVRTQTPPKMDRDAANEGAVKTGTFTVDAPAALYAMEADAFSEVVAGKREPFVTRADSAGNVALQAAMRKRLGLGY